MLAAEQFELLERLRKRHEQRRDALGIDFDAIYDAYTDARRKHHDVEAVIPPEVMTRLYAWGAAEQEHLDAVDAVMGRPPMRETGPWTTHDTILGVPAVMEDTDSGGVEFRPATSRSR